MFPVKGDSQELREWFDVVVGVQAGFSAIKFLRKHCPDKVSGCGESFSCFSRLALARLDQSSVIHAG